MRVFFFLEGKIDFATVSEYPVRQYVPLMLDTSAPEVRPEVSPEADNVKGIKTKVDDSSKRVRETYDSYSYDMLGTVFTDPTVVKVLRAGVKPDTRKEVIQKAFERHKDEAMEKLSTWIDSVGSSIEELNNLNHILKNVGYHVVALQNHDVLSTAVDLPAKKALLFSELNKLAELDILLVSSESFCLDCYFIRRRTPFQGASYNTRTFNLLEKCPSCGFSGVVHRVIFEYPRGVHKLILPETTWLQEVVLGYSVAKLDHVKRVFVHKNFQEFFGGTLSKAVESDVVVITDDGRVILLEVTTQSDADNIHQNLRKKQRYADELGLHYDGYVYVTASASFDKFLRLDDKTRIFGARHLANINEFLRKEFNL